MFCLELELLGSCFRMYSWSRFVSYWHLASFVEIMFDESTISTDMLDFDDAYKPEDDSYLIIVESGALKNLFNGCVFSLKLEKMN